MATGANRSLVSFYTYLALDQATVQCQAVELTGQTERGLNVYTTALTIPSGTTATLRLELHGGARLVESDGDLSFRLTVGHQVMPNPDTVDVRVAAQGDWSLDPKPPLVAVERSGAARWNAKLLRRTTLQATLSQ